MDTVQVFQGAGAIEFIQSIYRQAVPAQVEELFERNGAPLAAILVVTGTPRCQERNRAGIWTSSEPSSVLWRLPGGSAGDWLILALNGAGNGEDGVALLVGRDASGRDGVSPAGLR